MTADLDTDANLRVTATVTANDDGFSAELWISSPTGETTRTLSSPRCATLLDAVAFIAAAAQAEARLLASPLEDNPAPDAPLVETPETQTDTQTETQTGSDPFADPAPDKFAPTPAQPRTEPLARASADTRPSPAVRPIALHVRAYGRAGIGLMPRFDAGGGLAAGLGWQWLRVEAFGGVVTGAQLQIEQVSTANARILAWSVGLRGCAIAWSSATGSVAFPLCASASAGQFVGRPGGSGLIRAQQRSIAWFAASGGPGVIVRLTPHLSVVADVSLLVPVRRPGFGVAEPQDQAAEESGGLIFRPAQVTFRTTVGIEVHFPRRIGRLGGMR